jgi:hypothetical protein
MEAQTLDIPMGAASLLQARFNERVTVADECTSTRRAPAQRLRSRPRALQIPETGIRAGRVAGIGLLLPQNQRIGGKRLGKPMGSVAETDPRSSGRR